MIILLTAQEQPENEERHVAPRKQDEAT